MKMYQRRIEHFAYYDFDGITNHLEHMAYNGWALSRITPWFWEYQKATPRTYTYALTFSKADFLLDTQTEDAPWYGIHTADWNYVTNWNHLHIYCTEGKAKTKPQESRQSCLDMVQMYLRRHIVPSAIFMMIFSILSLYFGIQNIQQTPVLFLTDSVLLMTFVLWALLAVYQMVRIIHGASWIKRTKQMPKSGVAPISQTQRRIGHICYFGMLIFFLLQTILLFMRVFSGRSLSVWLVSIGGIFLLISLRKILRSRRRNAGVYVAPHGENTRLFVFLLIMVMAAISTTLFGEKYEHFLYKRPIAVYQTTLATGIVYDFPIYQDAMPLTIEDLQKTTSMQNSKRYDIQSSLLGTYRHGVQTAPPNDNEAAEISYVILDSRISPFLELAQNRIMSREGATQIADTRRIQYQTITQQGVDIAYQKYYQDEPCNAFIFRKGHRLVQISLSWSPSWEQISTIIEKLFSEAIS